MRSLHIPMTFEEWDLTPWRFGWKHEYFGGRAHITPRHDHVRFRGRIPTTELSAGLSMRSVSPGDAPGLIEAFIETFEDGVEFCDWTEEMNTPTPKTTSPTSSPENVEIRYWLRGSLSKERTSSVRLFYATGTTNPSSTSSW